MLGRVQAERAAVRVDPDPGVVEEGERRLGEPAPWTGSRSAGCRRGQASRAPVPVRCRHRKPGDRRGVAAVSVARPVRDPGHGRRRRARPASDLQVGQVGSREEPGGVQAMPERLQRRERAQVAEEGLGLLGSLEPAERGRERSQVVRVDVVGAHALMRNVSIIHGSDPAGSRVHRHPRDRSCRWAGRPPRPGAVRVADRLRRRAGDGEAVLGGRRRALHVVDLDAARTGHRSVEHARILDRLSRERPSGALLQMGGGFRDGRSIRDALSLGIDRVLVGTFAFRDPAAFAEAVAESGRSICVTADALDGLVRIAGWLRIPASASGHDRAAPAGSRRHRVPRHGDRTRRHARRPGSGASPPRPRSRRRRAPPGLGRGGTVEHIAATRDAQADGVVVGRALLSGEIAIADALALERPERASA